MLWPEGSTSNWSQLPQLLNKGYDATKAVDPSIKVIVHIDKGNDNARFRWFFDNATANNVKYDVIGMSYYPYWLNSDYTATIAACLAKQSKRYGFQIRERSNGCGNRRRLYLGSKHLRHNSCGNCSRKKRAKRKRNWRELLGTGRRKKLEWVLIECLAV